MQQELERGHWQPDARLGQRTLRDCCEAYLEENPRVGERWAETCRRNMRLHLEDLLDRPIATITPPMIRAWHAKALRGPGGRTSISQSYRFIRAVLNVAVQDGADRPQPLPDSRRRRPTIRRAGHRHARRDRAADRSHDTSFPSSRGAGRLVRAAPRRDLRASGQRRRPRCRPSHRAHATTWNCSRHRASSRRTPRARPASARSRSPRTSCLCSRTRSRATQAPTYFVADRTASRSRGNTIYQAFVRARDKVGLTHRLPRPAPHRTVTGGRYRRQPRRPQEAARTLLDRSGAAIHARRRGAGRADRRRALQARRGRRREQTAEDVLMAYRTPDRTTREAGR